MEMKSSEHLLLFAVGVDDAADPVTSSNVCALIDCAPSAQLAVSGGSFQLRVPLLFVTAASRLHPKTWTPEHASQSVRQAMANVQNGELLTIADVYAAIEPDYEPADEATQASQSSGSAPTADTSESPASTPREPSEQTAASPAAGGTSGSSAASLAEGSADSEQATTENTDELGGAADDDESAVAEGTSVADGGKADNKSADGGADAVNVLYCRF